MKTKSLIIAGVIVIAGVMGYLYFNSGDNSEQGTQESVQPAANDIESEKVEPDSLASLPPATEGVSKKVVPTADEEQGQFSGEEDIQSPDVMVYEISYNGTSYSPSNLTIKNGDVVVFKNNSDKDFWPASGPHPQHTNYPEFDAKKSIAGGGTYQFKFTKNGSWGFHDHKNPSAFGSIKVE